MEYINPLVDDVQAELDTIQWVGALQKRTGFKGKSAHVLLGCAALGALLVLVGVFDQFVTNLFGVIYPAYRSFQAIETDRKDDDTQWLTYWVVFGVFTVIDSWSSAVLKYFPPYFIVKLAFLVWLFSPQWNGAHKLYHRFIRTWLLGLEHSVDGAVSGAESHLAAMEARAKRRGEVYREVATDAAAAAAADELTAAAAQGRGPTTPNSGGSASARLLGGLVGKKGGSAVARQAWEQSEVNKVD